MRAEDRRQGEARWEGGEAELGDLLGDEALDALDALDDDDGARGAPDVGAMYAEVEGALARERGWRAWLRARPTWQRWAASLLAVVGTATGVVWLTPRSDLGIYPTLQLGVVIGLFAFGLVVAVAGALRPLHRPTLSGSVAVTVAVAVGIGVPVAVAMVPVASSVYCGVASTGRGFWAGALGCFMSGLPAAAPLLVLLWLLARDGAGWPQRLVLAAAGAGLASNLALQLHCPSASLGHLLAGHVALAAIFVLAAWLTGQRRRGGAVAGAR